MGLKHTRQSDLLYRCRENANVRGGSLAFKNPVFIALLKSSPNLPLGDTQDTSTADGSNKSSTDSDASDVAAKASTGWGEDEHPLHEVQTV